jgi:uncharacterized RDD family membrane protein YckC
MQVRAHKVRKRRRLDPDSPLLEFEEPDLLPNEESPVVRQRSNWAWEHEATTPMHSPAPGVHEHSAAYETSQSAPDVAVEEPIIPAPAVVQEEPIHYYEERITERPPLPPLAPFPRITAPLHKVIEFPRMQPRQYELADPVADQLRIFEAVEELPRPAVTHLSTIEIAPEEPAHITAAELEVPIQAAPVPLRAYAAAVDSAVMIAALALFAFSADFFASSLPRTKPLVACAAVCTFLLLTLYYLLSFSLHRNTVGIDAAGLKVITFSGDTPSRTRLRCRALATVLSYAALGMGFAWSFIDEDRLCWHDRITHTYLSSK